jgi:hypothetical protein
MNQEVREAGKHFPSPARDEHPRFPKPITNLSVDNILLRQFSGAVTERAEPEGMADPTGI